MKLPEKEEVYVLCNIKKNVFVWRKQPKLPEINPSIFGTHL